MPRQARCPWTKEEDDIITQLVLLHERQWSKIANDLQARTTGQGKVRTGKQCRERWHNHLNPTVNKDEWTAEEDVILEEAHQRLGYVDFFLFLFMSPLRSRCFSRNFFLLLTKFFTIVSLCLFLILSISSLLSQSYCFRHSVYTQYFLATSGVILLCC
mgnify:CR=1 FL=1|tara:strand:- start:55 stop:528 length:474 start_codon:yes stop_codon:yes gene_type:complete